MSRSYRHTSICGLASAASEKDDKRRWHRPSANATASGYAKTESHSPSTL